MSWIDHVLAVPVVGIRFSKWLAFPHAIWPVVDTLVDSWDKHTEVSSSTTFDVRLAIATGFTVDIDTTNIVGQFTYKGIRNTQPGKMPTVTLPPEPSPYTHLLTTVTDYVMQVTQELSAVVQLGVDRIGIVAECHFAYGTTPPGITNLIDRFAAPWKQGLQACDTTLLVLLNETADHLDRCHHGISFNQVDKPGHVKVRLDWQRNLVHRRKRGSEEIATLMAESKKEAMQYFERFGSGVDAE